ncbi:hypothetical protein FJY93_04440 [Candidatus Kaiserbacteria bacterium]|nr:hypothetical protein [Candidatus Kaiserbacteria bacterium]
MGSSKNVVDLRKGKRPATPDQRRQSPARMRVADTSARTSPLREKRRRIRFVLAIVCAVLIGIIAFELSYVSYLPRYLIDSVAVQGTDKVPVDLVERFVATKLNSGTYPFLAPNNVLLFNEQALEVDIVGFFPRIKSAQVSRPSLLANSLVAVIEERQEFAQWCAVPGVWRQRAPEDCYSMDDGGFVFAQAEAQTPTSTQKYVFSGGFSSSQQLTAASSSPATTTPAVNPIGKTFAAGHLPGILIFFGQLQKAGFTPVGASLDGNGSDFTVPVREGFAIKASFGQDASVLVRNLGLILSADALKGRQDDIEYIDLRFGDRAYYKLKGEDTVTRQATSTPTR